MAAAKRYELAVPADAPPMVQACSLALQVLKTSGVATWTDLALAIRADNIDVLIKLDQLEVSETQQKMLDHYSRLLTTLRLKPARTVAVCPECYGWFYTDGRLPTRCPVGWQCSGKPVKASAAKRVPILDE